MTQKNLRRLISAILILTALAAVFLARKLAMDNLTSAASNIPALYLTSGVPKQSRSFVDADKSNQTTGSMRLVTPDGITLYDGALSQIKARGNSTFTYYPKKAYQIKLESKADLLGTGEQGKTWVLLASYADATLMHDKLLKDLAAELGMPYVASSGWVDLYYDGEYRGVYQLSEKNSVSSTSVDITDLEDAYEALNPNYGDDLIKTASYNRYGQVCLYLEDLTEPDDLTGGYLIELNHDQPDEICGFYTRREQGVNVKSPEWAGQNALFYISEYYQEFEDAVYAQDEAGNYTGYNETTGLYFYDYVDLTSLVQTFLIQELSVNPDRFLSSQFFYKDRGSKMYAGPIWDMDMTFGTGWSKENAPDVNYVKPYLAQALVRIPAFQEALRTYYTTEFLPAVQKWLGEDGVIEQHYALLERSAQRNYQLWPYVRIGSPSSMTHLWQGVDYRGAVNDLENWVSARLDLLSSLYLL